MGHGAQLGVQELGQRSWSVPAGIRAGALAPGPALSVRSNESRQSLLHFTSRDRYEHAKWTRKKNPSLVWRTLTLWSSISWLPCCCSDFLDIGACPHVFSFKMCQRYRSFATLYVLSH